MGAYFAAAASPTNSHTFWNKRRPPVRTWST